jgi:osmotically-inducible protein OsmY
MMPSSGRTQTPESPLVAAARHALRQSSYPQLRRVDVSFHEGLLVLRGRVPSYHFKQLAQVAVMAVPGFPGLRNELEVIPVR